MSVETPIPGPADILAAAKSIASHLSSVKYAIVGGAALTLLGSERVTTDVDVVVCKGMTKVARGLLRASSSGCFVVEARTGWTWFKNTEGGGAQVSIEILTPPLLFRERFDEGTETVDVEGVRVLKPTLLLNAKCSAILQRSTSEKKMSDANDIQFLLVWCAGEEGERYGCKADAEEVPNVGGGFVEWFVGEYGGRELWRDVGWDFEVGRFGG